MNLMALMDHFMSLMTFTDAYDFMTLADVKLYQTVLGNKGSHSVRIRVKGYDFKHLKISFRIPMALAPSWPALWEKETAFRDITGGLCTQVTPYGSHDCGGRIGHASNALREPRLCMIVEIAARFFRY